MVLSARPRGWRRIRLVTLAVATVVAALVAAAGSPSAAQARSCPGFSYEHRTGHVTYEFYDLRVSGARCSVIKKVVYGFFRDRGERAGPLPTDGYNVYGWNVLLHTNTLDGNSGRRRFSGLYRI